MSFTNHQRSLVRRLLEREWRVVDGQVLRAQARCCFEGHETASERAIRKQALKVLKARLTTIERTLHQVVLQVESGTPPTRL